jgi:PPOX class probable F420-dependent enzyme
MSLDAVRSLLEAPSAAVLTTTRKDGSALTSPVWYRWPGGHTFEIVIAAGDVKLQHLGRDPRCSLVIFEAIPPFRGVEVRGAATLTPGDMAGIRRSIAGRYLGSDELGARYAVDRAAKPGVLVQLNSNQPRVWNLSHTCCRASAPVTFRLRSARRGTVPHMRPRTERAEPRTDTRDSAL